MNTETQKVDVLARASAGVLSDIEAMIAAADRGEVWIVNAGTRARVDELRAALTSDGGAA